MKIKKRKPAPTPASLPDTGHPFYSGQAFDRNVEILKAEQHRMHVTIENIVRGGRVMDLHTAQVLLSIATVMLVELEKSMPEKPHATTTRR